MFLISNLQIPIHFLLSFLASYEHEILVLWLAINNMRPQQKLMFLFYVKKYFRIKKRRRQTLMTLLINLVLFSFSFLFFSYPSSKFCNSYLLKNFTLIKALFFLIKHFSSLYTDFTCNVFFFLWLFNSYDYRDNPQLVFFSSLCSVCFL